MCSARQRISRPVVSRTIAATLSVQNSSLDMSFTRPCHPPSPSSKWSKEGPLSVMIGFPPVSHPIGLQGRIIDDYWLASVTSRPIRNPSTQHVPRARDASGKCFCGFKVDLPLTQHPLNLPLTPPPPPPLM